MSDVMKFPTKKQKKDHSDGRNIKNAVAVAFLQQPVIQILGVIIECIDLLRTEISKAFVSVSVVVIHACEKNKHIKSYMNNS